MEPKTGFRLNNRCAPSSVSSMEKGKLDTYKSFFFHKQYFSDITIPLSLNVFGTFETLTPLTSRFFDRVYLFDNRYIDIDTGI